MADIVKELNEIKDVFDEDTKDGTNVVDAIDGIREALEKDGVWKSSKNVADALENVKGAFEDAQPKGKITITENGNNIDVKQYAKADVNVAGIQFRNYTLEYELDGEFTIDGGYVCMAYYSADGTLIVHQDIEGSSAEAISAKLPIINNRCDILLEMTSVPTMISLKVGSSGCSLHDNQDGTYVLSINENNAVVKLNLEQSV